MNPLYVASAVCTLALLPMQTLAELASADHGTAVALALAIGASICLLAGLYLQDDRRFLVEPIRGIDDLPTLKRGIRDSIDNIRNEAGAIDAGSPDEYARRVVMLRAGAESGLIRVAHEQTLADRRNRRGAK